MRVLRGTLTFVLGMVIGIILFVLAIGGVVVVLGTSTTVGQLQQKFTQEDIISPDSTLYNQTVLDAIKSIIADVQGLDSLTLEKLYDHYGIALFKGISGIDFTNKAFYTAPLKEMLGDLSIVVNSFTLNDVSGLAGVDFSSFGLPILNDNLDNNVQGAINNIMGALNGDLSVRKIKDNFGIDIGTGDNKLIATVQDVSLSSFGSVVNAITLDKLLDVDSDSFIAQGKNQVYVKADEYEQVSLAELKNKSYSPALGVETYIAGAKDTDGDGTTDKLDEKELRYIKKTVKAEDGSESVKYVVDNSCYAESFNADESGKTFFRHVLYKTPTTVPENINDLFLVTYANRISTFDGANYTLVQKAFTPVKDIVWGATPTPTADGKLNVQSVKCTLEDGKLEDSAKYYITDSPITKDSMLRTLEEGETASGTAYLRTHRGTSATILQIVAHMSVVELQKADKLLNSLTVGDVVDTSKPGTSKAIIALKDCKITEIGTKINTLKIDELIDVNDESATILKALKKRGCTLNDMSTIVDTLTIGEVLDIVYDKYTPAADGAYVAIDVYVPFNEFAHVNEDGTPFERFAKDGENYVADANGGFVKLQRFRLYDEKTDGASVTRYSLVEGETALALQQMAKRGYTLKNIGSELNNMYFDELVRIKAGDNALMKTLSKKDATLNNLSSVVDTLKVDEVIEINDESARIMKSLAARECLVKDLGTVANNLTLAETIDIQFYKYTKNANGRYVKVVEGDKYVYCDNNEHFTADRFEKNSEGNYVPSASGKFAHPFYFTLYNAAIHSGIERFDCVKEDPSDASYKPSSKVLQRLAYSSLGEFSNAFSSLTLGDVMDVDIDLMARDETANPTTSYFYYDVNNDVYMRQTEAFDASSVEAKYQNFKVTSEGTSSSVIKRLAYVKVDNLSSAMEIVMKDMLLSELIDVYEFSTVKTRTDTAAVVESDRFIVPSMGKEKVDGKEQDYTFVYDKAGKYIKRDYHFEKADVSTLTQSGTTTYKYVQVTDPKDTDLFGGNAYYHDLVHNEYVHNLALCTYVIAQNTHVSLTPPSTTLSTDKIYKRVASSDADVITAKTYSDSGLYVLVNGIYEPYNPTNLTHLDADLYKRDDGTCYVDASTPDDGTNTFKRQKDEPLYSKQYCENIYVQDEAGDVVIINNKPVAYVEAEHGTSVQRYKTVVGYLAVANEVYLKNGDAYESPLDHYTPHAATNRVEVEHEKSEAVLRMLAKNQVTIANINGVVKDAKISDLMDVTEGSLFYKFRNSSLNNLSRDVEGAFTNMTMGELLTYANVADVDAKVKSAIEPITLANFFKSLEYKQNAGIVVNLEKAYGYSA